MNKALRKMTRRRDFIIKLRKDISITTRRFNDATSKLRCVNSDKAALQEEVVMLKAKREDLYVVLNRMTVVKKFPSRFKPHIITVDGTSHPMAIHDSIGKASAARGVALRHLLFSGEVKRGSGQATSIVSRHMQPTSYQPLTTKKKVIKNDESSEGTNKT